MKKKERGIGEMRGNNRRKERGKQYKTKSDERKQ